MKDNANSFVVCSVRSKEQFKEMIDRLFLEKKYVVFEWHGGQTAKLTQLAVAHIWLRTWIAQAKKIREEDVTEESIEEWKHAMKRKFYELTGESFMVNRRKDPHSATGYTIEYTSMGKWTPSQLYTFMDWMQRVAGELGIILEAQGEFEENKQQNA